MRASIRSWSAGLRTGPSTAKKMCAGSPSTESNGTPSGLIAITTLKSGMSTRPCGIATPLPTPVVASRSRSENARYTVSSSSKPSLCANKRASARSVASLSLVERSVRIPSTLRMSAKRMGVLPESDGERPDRAAVTAQPSIAKFATQRAMHTLLARRHCSAAPARYWPAPSPGAGPRRWFRCCSLERLSWRWILSTTTSIEAYMSGSSARPW